LSVIFDPFVVHGSVPSEYGIHLMACFFIVHHHGGKLKLKASRPRHDVHPPFPLKPELAAPPPDDADFLQKALLNESLWEKLLASGKRILSGCAP